MKKTLQSVLICPFDKNSDLHLFEFEQHNTDIQSGLLYCDQCMRYYPIIESIPIMLPDIQRNFLFESTFLSKWYDKIPDLIKSNSMPFKIKNINREL